MTNIFKILGIGLVLAMSSFATIAQESSAVNSTENTSVAGKAKQGGKDDSWTGFYVGGFGGYTNGKSNAVTSTTYQNVPGIDSNEVPRFNRLGDMKIKSTNFNAGGTFGYNHQKRNFLVGLEADFGVNKIDASGSESETYVDDGTQNITINQNVKTDWLATFRPRAGVAAKKVLVYGTAGMAITNIAFSEDYLRIEDGTGRAATQSASFKKTKIGWTVGVGAEFKVSKRLSLKGEYLYAQFGKTSITSNNHTGYSVFGAEPHPLNIYSHSADLKMNIVRFGVNYRF
ncbi:MAG TPA: outer membrane beta-barrel protein [Pyrinomonadaceae bacterium]|nr:outer membrane beta-barrel protein [Pyrinomonadaceae bacterium]